LRHLVTLAGLFQQVQLLCQRQGLVKPGPVAIGGTKVKANASKHAAMSYSRMKPEADRIKAEIDAWFTACDRVDAEEDERYGADPSGDELPEELQTAERRRAALRKALEELKEEAAQAAKDEPNPKAQRNCTDPESRGMKGSEGAFIQGYNAQAAVGATSQVIVAATLTNRAADAPQLLGVVDQIAKNLGGSPVEVSADAGYCSEANLNGLRERGNEAYVATGRMPPSYRCSAAPRGRIPASRTPRERMKRKLTTKRGRARYHLRQQVAEPVFGQSRNKGLIRIWLRGEEKAEREWLLHCTGHNLSKLHGAWA
jgi:hypothetical protein